MMSKDSYIPLPPTLLKLPVPINLIWCFEEKKLTENLYFHSEKSVAAVFSIFYGLIFTLFLPWQRSYDLSTLEGYSGYGAEQGEKVFAILDTCLLSTCILSMVLMFFFIFFNFGYPLYAPIMSYLFGSYKIQDGCLAYLLLHLSELNELRT